VSWSAQYPSVLYPGVQRVTEPELPVFPGTRYPLAWYRPDSWWRLGRSLRASGGMLVLVLVTPVQIPAYLTMIAALGRRRPGRLRPAVAVICHNVLPHETRPGDRALTKALLARADVVLTHTDEQAALACELGATDVRAAELPPHVPGTTAGRTEGAAAEQNRGGNGLLFFGFIRPYKGIGVLLRAVAQVPDVRLTVAGEAWEGEEKLRALVDELGLAERVDLRLAYVPSDELEQLFRDADAVVLPYTSGTGTQQVRLAQTHGVPVIASRVSTIPEQVTDGEDGLLVAPGDVEDLAAAIRRLYEPGRLERMRAAVRPPDDDAIWRRYLDTLTGTTAQPGPADRAGG
jgi:glycosyltransferase involved in cell wall biosynthesis